MNQRLRTIKRLVTKKTALVLVAPVMVLTVLAAPVGFLGQFGTQSAKADCGYWYQYGQNGIYTNSDACKWYFDNNGWHVYTAMVAGCDANGNNCTGWDYWLHRDGS